ncbi:MAG: hypothetical protein HC848_05715 [Limnobacter sp.]|nr:hypothetical protein [Limnobacter sp.]
MLLLIQKNKVNSKNLARAKAVGSNLTILRKTCNKNHSVKMHQALPTHTFQANIMETSPPPANPVAAPAPIPHIAGSFENTEQTTSHFRQTVAGIAARDSSNRLSPDVYPWQAQNLPRIKDPTEAQRGEISNALFLKAISESVARCVQGLPLHEHSSPQTEPSSPACSDKEIFPALPSPIESFLEAAPNDPELGRFLQWLTSSEPPQENPFQNPLSTETQNPVVPTTESEKPKDPTKLVSFLKTYHYPMHCYKKQQLLLRKTESVRYLTGWFKALTTRQPAPTKLTQVR